ncbi:hypothetical protein [Nitrolancea hollandica]|uniref:Uncharacterized protein n=1 Tax=Nitrolancea hollandica Lb TaxID=1129897 RepID=I4EHV6_9BACT|nr:hypothetical protein [Nitrolancea hollandica]CCF84268.1 conserved hypothetical protein [Nitrolancea hollandica Lb]
MDDEAGVPVGGEGLDAGVAPGATAVPEPGDPAEVLGKVRALIISAIPDLVPELLVGDSVEALVASVEPAKQAYQRIVEQMRAGSAGSVTDAASQAASGTNASIPTAANRGAAPPAIPAGQPGRQRVSLELDGLSASAKIAEGLRRRNG